MAGARPRLGTEGTGSPGTAVRARRRSAATEPQPELHPPLPDTVQPGWFQRRPIVTDAGIATRAVAERIEHVRLRSDPGDAGVREQAGRLHQISDGLVRPGDDPGLRRTVRPSAPGDEHPRWSPGRSAALGAGDTTPSCAARLQRRPGDFTTVRATVRRLARPGPAYSRSNGADRRRAAHELCATLESRRLPGQSFARVRPAGGPAGRIANAALGRPHRGTAGRADVRRLLCADGSGATQRTPLLPAARLPCAAGVGAYPGSAVGCARPALREPATDRA